MTFQVRDYSNTPIADLRRIARDAEDRATRADTSEAWLADQAVADAARLELERRGEAGQ